MCGTIPAYVNRTVVQKLLVLLYTLWPLPHQPSVLGSMGVFFSSLHAFHFSIYMLKMVGYVTILGLSQHNNSAALLDLELLNYLK
jgi:hypothetical protein